MNQNKAKELRSKYTELKDRFLAVGDVPHFAAAVSEMDWLYSLVPAKSAEGASKTLMNTGGTESQHYRPEEFHARTVNDAHQP